VSVIAASGRTVGHDGFGGAIGAIVLRVSVLVALLVIWQVLTTINTSPYFPTFTTTTDRLVRAWLLNPQALTTHLIPSVGRLLAGWSLAIVLGIGIGTLIGMSATARDYLDPIVQFLRAIPPPALIPLFIVLLGIGDSMKVAMITFGVIWPILLNTIDGVRSVETLQLDTGRAFRIGLRDRLVRIVLPSAAPKIFAGLRISLSIAVILMVISEMIATINGVGFTIVQAQRTFRLVDMWAGIVLLGIIGYGLNLGLAVIERRVLHWQAGAMRLNEP
jgi:ABC-type nitrate/sulfonate/bicarbonate transport system permease component